MQPVSSLVGVRPCSVSVLASSLSTFSASDELHPDEPLDDDPEDPQPAIAITATTATARADLIVHLRIDCLLFLVDKACEKPGLCIGLPSADRAAGKASAGRRQPTRDPRCRGALPRVLHSGADR